MNELTLVYPHQLFEENPALSKDRDVLLIEDHLFFRDYNYPVNFHKQKLLFQRASMKYYEVYLKSLGYTVHYLDYSVIKDDQNQPFKWIKSKKYKKIFYADTVDFILEKRINKLSEKYDLEKEKFTTPAFLNDEDWLKKYFRNSKGYFLHTFYIAQRKKYKILVDADLKPLGDKWSLDSENRKSIPKGMSLPDDDIIERNKYIREAENYVEKYFPDNPGNIEKIYFPVTHDEAKERFEKFLNSKFENFGAYQDAISAKEKFLFHSLISPLINSGLQEKIIFRLIHLKAL